MSAKPARPSPAKKNSVEDMDRNNDTTSQTDKHSNQSETEIPPNENIRKFPDEIYGDTEIPGRDTDL
jgi:hypothetical protein